MPVVAKRQETPQFAEIAQGLKDSQRAELEAVNEVILAHLGSSVELIPQVARHLIGAGGKRLRPLLCLASAAICGRPEERARLLAGAVELIHAATLLHDDVVDDSALRRGLSTANVVFGNKESVLVGDFLFARAFELMVKTGELRVLEILSRASCTISEGEVLQLSTQGEIATREETYIEVIDAKTAALFGAATEAGAIVGGGSAAEVEAFAAFGRHFGLAYQLVDDAIDYAGDASETGKTAGDDFREGKMTLPVILAYRAAARDEERDFWERTIGRREQSATDFEQAVALIRRHRGVERTLEMANQHAARAAEALAVFPHSALRGLLEDLALSSPVRRI
jgi:octaprenyl-diphosphate synthase